jgi:YVTN family beta-propeller protein
MIRVIVGLLAATSLFGQTSYHLLKKISVPGDGGFDYLTVDSPAGRLYVSHGTQIEVIDTKTDAVVGKLPNTKGVHGVALVPGTHQGFTSNGAANDSTIFDLKTLTEIGHVPTGKKPDAIIYDAGSKRVIVNNGESDNATIIDPATGKATGTIPLGGAPEFAAGDGKGKVFINLEDKSEAVKVDPVALKVDARWPLKPCEAPSAMAIDTAANRLFIGCRNHLAAVVNPQTGKVVATMKIGDHVDAAAFDDSAKLLFFSNGDGTVNIFHEDSPDQYSLVQTLNTQAGAKTMALDPATHKIYLSVAERNGRIVKPGTFQVLVYGKLNRVAPAHFAI